MKKTQAESAARQLREKILASEERFWRVDELHGSLSPAAVASELRRLVEAGELEHVRRGLYWRGRKTRFGMSVPHEGLALRQLLGEREAVGASAWHATNLLGLSTQVSPIEVLAVTRRPPAGFEHLRLIDRSSRTGRRDHGLTDLEVTILEALEGWDRFVEVGRRAATARFMELLGRDDVSVDRLVAASATESAAVRERLRAALLAGG